MQEPSFFGDAEPLISNAESDNNKNPTKTALESILSFAKISLSKAIQETITQINTSGMSSEEKLIEILNYLFLQFLSTKSVLQINNIKAILCAALDIKNIQPIENPSEQIRNKIGELAKKCLPGQLTYWHMKRLDHSYVTEKNMYLGLRWLSVSSATNKTRKLLYRCTDNKQRYTLLENYLNDPDNKERALSKYFKI